MRLLRRRNLPPQAESQAESQGEARASLEINWLLMLLIAAMVLGAAALILLNLEVLPQPILDWWPLALLIPAALWFLGALIRRSPRGLLRSTALLGVAVSLLLAAQNFAPIGATLMGVVLIAVGTGLLLRGLLMTQQPLA